eukprot:12111558-Ditylum_brightwellii.AAC.1
MIYLPVLATHMAFEQMTAYFGTFNQVKDEILLARVQKHTLHYLSTAKTRVAITVKSYGSS